MIMLSQWLCEKRHCSIGFLWDDRAETRQSIEERGEALYQSGKINRYCAICFEGLHVEHMQTNFRSVDEASPHVADLELRNALGAALIKKFREESRN